jgi:hypothetical protein
MQITHAYLWTLLLFFFGAILLQGIAQSLCRSLMWCSGMHIHTYICIHIATFWSAFTPMSPSILVKCTHSCIKHTNTYIHVYIIARFDCSTLTKFRCLVYAHTYMYIHVCMYVFTSRCTHTKFRYVPHIYLYVYTHIHTHVCMYICVCIYIHACMYMCIYIYIC